MSTKTYPLKLPASLKDAAARLAKADGVSLNQWIATAVAQKVGVVETAREFLRVRAGDATGQGLGSLLDLVRPVEPLPEDALPKERRSPSRRSKGRTG
jgi:hypothetical protein